MPKRKREVDDSDDLVDSFEPESEAVISKQKKKRNKQTPAQDAESEDEETVSQTLKKKMKKKKHQSTEITDEETTQVKGVTSENEESLSLSRKRKKKRNKQRSLAEKEAKSSESLETSETKPNLPSTKKKAMMSKGFVLFVGQVPHHIKKNDLEKHFATVGGIKDVRLLIYEDSQRPRGCAYVEFVDNEHRKAALKLNGSTLGRAKIKVEYPYQGGKRYGGAKKNKSNAKNGKSRNE